MHEVAISEADEIEAERIHWRGVLKVLRSYKSYVEKDLRRRQQHLGRLPESITQLLPEATFEQLWAIDKAAEFNQTFLNDIPAADTYAPVAISASDQHRNSAILHSLYREWSAEGADEREQTFGRLVAQLVTHLPVYPQNAYRQKVLVPGCGLGRLPLEIAARGYCCQGNEYSAYMVAPANFVLNEIREKESYSIHPWVDKVCNVVKMADVLGSVEIPDITAESALQSCPYFTMSDDNAMSDVSGGNDKEVQNDTESPPQHEMKLNPDFPKFSMCIGNFVELYGGSSEADRWSAVVTCFFIDTAPVVVDYIQTVYHALQPGGLWINIGPLLYHWIEDTDHNLDERYAQSIELSWEEVLHVITAVGFEVIEVDWHNVHYTRWKDSMMWTTFRCNDIDMLVLHL